VQFSEILLGTNITVDGFYTTVVYSEVVTTAFFISSRRWKRFQYKVLNDGEIEDPIYQF